MKKIRLLYDGTIFADGFRLGSNCPRVFPAVYHIFCELLKNPALDVILYADPASAESVRNFVRNDEFIRNYPVTVIEDPRNIEPNVWGLAFLNRTIDFVRARKNRFHDEHKFFRCQALRGVLLGQKIIRRIMRKTAAIFGSRDPWDRIQAAFSPAVPSLPEIFQRPKIKQYTIRCDALPYIFPGLFPEAGKGPSWYLNLFDGQDTDNVCFAVPERIKKKLPYFSRLFRNQDRAFQTGQAGSKKAAPRIPRSIRSKFALRLKQCSHTRVIIVSNYYPPNFIGGAEIIAHNQAVALMKQQLADVFVFALDVTGKHRPGEICYDEPDGIPVFRLAVDGSSFNQTGINFFNQEIDDVFEAICGLVRPDIVHCHNIIGMSLGIIDIARRYHAGTCVTLHDNWGFCFKQTCLDNNSQLCQDVFHCEKCRRMFTQEGVSFPVAVRKQYFRRLFEKIDAYISPSSYLAREYIKAGFNPHKMNVLWNGIDLAKFSKVRHVISSNIRISFIGYVGGHKGLDILIRAVAMLNRKDVKIQIAGQGDMADKCRQLADSLGMGGQLVFLGKVDNAEIGQVYAKTDIYCLPSRWPENQPVTITEAMACSLPVVASDLGGSPELVRHEVTGLVFEKENVQDLAMKLKKLIDDPGLRTRYGKAGFDLISGFSFDKQVKKLKEIYGRMLAKPASVPQKAFVAVNRPVVPRGVAEVTSLDILPADWVVDEKEWQNAVAYLYLPGEEVEEEDFEFIKAHKLKLIVPTAEYLAVKETFGRYENMVSYVSYGQMLRCIARLDHETIGLNTYDWFLELAGMKP